MASKNPVVIIVYKGGPGSGFHRSAGHYGIPGMRGGSTHQRFITKRQWGVMSHNLGSKVISPETRAASTAHIIMKKPEKPGTAITYRDGLFYSGDLTKVKGSEEIYAGSHPDVQALADKTGLLATDAQSYKHIQLLDQMGAVVPLGTVAPNDARNAEKLRDVEHYITGARANMSWNNGNVYSPNYTYGYTDLVKVNIKTLSDKSSYNDYTLLRAEDMIRKLELSKASGMLDGADLAAYDKLISDHADSLKSTLYTLGFHNDSLDGNSPLEHESRINGVLNSFNELLTGQNGKRDYAVYDSEGNVVKHQLAKSNEIKLVRELVNNPNASIHDLWDVYDRTVNTRAKLKDDEYYTPNGDKTTKHSTTHYMYGKQTTYERTDAIAQSIDYLDNRYPGMTIGQLQGMLKNAEAAMPGSMYNINNGKGTRNLGLRGYLETDMSTFGTAERHNLVAIARKNEALAGVNYYAADSSYYAPTGSKAIKMSDVNWNDVEAGNTSAFWDGYQKANAQLFAPKSTAPTKNFSQYAALSYLPKAEFDKVKAKVTADWDTSAHSFNGTIRGAYRIISSEAHIAANAAVRAKVGGQELETYHGTTYGRGRNIAATGFKIMSRADNGRMLGDGIYIATKSSKSAQYLGEQFTHSPGTQGVLFIVRSTLGKIRQVTNNDTTGSSYWNPILKKYDTVWGQKGMAGLRNEEACTADPAQNMPIYWLDTVLN